MIKTGLFEEVVRQEIDRGCFVLDDRDEFVRMETHDGRWVFEVKYESGVFFFFFEDSVRGVDSGDGYKCRVGSSEEAIPAFREFIWDGVNG